jgi:antitoxin HicB
VIAKVPLILDPQPEGGYTVTSPLLRGLVTEGDTIAEALFNAQDAFQVVIEIYEDLDRELPPELFTEHDGKEPLQIEILAPLPVPVATPAS